MVLKGWRSAQVNDKKRPSKVGGAGKLEIQLGERRERILIHPAPIPGFVSHTSGRKPLSTSSRTVPCQMAAGSRARRSWSTAATGSSASGLAMGLSPWVACRTEPSRRVPRAARVGSRAAPPLQPRTHQPAPALVTADGRARGLAWQAHCGMLALLLGARAASGSS